MTKPKNRELARTESEAHEALAKEATEGRRLKSVTVQNGAVVLEGSDAAQHRVLEAFGSDSREFQTYCLHHLLNLLPEGEDYTLPVNSAVAMLAAISPKDELEAMLAVQMVASNHMSMLSMRRCANSETLESRQMNGNLATKFSRTFNSQMEALDRHRRGGKQIVEHVHVNAGGQAVIAGTVTTGRGGE